MKFFEDIEVGEAAMLGSHVFTAAAIAAFAARFEPRLSRPDACDHDAPLPASGWQVACVWMRLLVDHRRNEDAVRRARGEPVATLGPSPGFRDLQWPAPVYAGDTVTYRNEVIDKRVSLSRPRWGLLMSRNSGHNQRGEIVLSFVSSAFVQRRPDGA
jgi:acyl dehydratase